MRQRDFEKLVEEGFMAIPERFREKVKNVALLIEDEPSEEVRAREGLQPDETLLGFYQGIPNTARGDGYGVGPTVPDTITVYRLPILEEAGGDLALVRDIVRDTVWHEIAHYFGMDECEVRSREENREAENLKL